MRSSPSGSCFRGLPVSTSASPPTVMPSAGAVLVPHGIQKIVNNSAEGLSKAISAHGLPFPLALAYLAIFVESVGATCLALGLFTRLAAVLLWIEMSVIIVVFQWEFGYFWTNRGIEYALLWWLLYLAIF